MMEDCFKVFRNIYSLLFYGVYTILYVTATTAAQWLLLFVVGSIVVVKDLKRCWHEMCIKTKERNNI